MSLKKQNVVIVGGDIGAIRAAKLLSRDPHYDTTLISSSKFLNTKSGLNQVTGKKGRERNKIALTDLFKDKKSNIDLVRAQIEKINPSKNQIISSDGVDYPYESLIISLNVEGTNSFNLAKDDFFSAYNYSDVELFRNKLIDQFENGHIDDNFVIIGGGQTGVQFATRLSRALDSLCRVYKVDRAKHQIILVESDKHILPKLSGKAASRVHRKLLKLNIQVLQGLEFNGFNGREIQLSDGTSIKTNKVILANGPFANHFFQINMNHFLLDEDGFVRVTSLLEAEGHNNIYVIGRSKSDSQDIDIEGIFYDARFVADILHKKKHGKQIDRYLPPDSIVPIEVTKYWVAYLASRNHFGFIGFIMKRWRDRKHFSKLIPVKAALRWRFFNL